MEQLLQVIVAIVAGTITAAGVLSILLAIAIVAVEIWRGFRGRQGYPSFQKVRGRIGQGLVLALELFVGADLLRTVFRPSLDDLIILSVIVVLRTIISLSLDYELRHASTTVDE